MKSKHVADKEKKQFRWRLAAAIGLHLLIALHLILWYGYGIRGVGAIDMQELFRNLIEKNMLTAGALFFLILLGASLLWGRVFCGWFCHIGQVYDLLAVLFRKLKIPLGMFPTRLGPFVAAFILLWYFLRESLQQREPGDLTLAWDATAPWELLPGWVNGTSLLVLVLVVMPLLMGARTFCRNLCPWGILLGLGNRFAPWKVRRVGDCTNCGACSPACPMDIDVSRVINVDFRVKSSACTQCLQCVAACPTDALAFSLPGHENREPRSLELLPPLVRISWPMELGFWTLTFLVGFTYDQLYGVGIFLAWSIGVVLAFCTLKIGSLFKHARTWAFAAILVVASAWVVVGKDAVADYHWEMGHRAWQKKDWTQVQHHYEQADRLFWQSPNVLMYRLYMIYKGTGQEEKRQEMYDRYERRRSAQGRST